MGVTARVGRCAACEGTARLEGELCPPCLRRHGPDRGRLFRMVRENPLFARQCYDRLEMEHQRRLFVSMFGLPARRTACRRS